MLNVIIVEDDFIVRNGLIHFVEWEKNGFKVCGEAANGREAFIKIEEVKPDIVITDIQMPIEDGLTLCEKIRCKYPHIKIIILSGHAEFDYARKALRLGVNEYLLKPIKDQELLAILRKFKKEIKKVEGEEPQKNEHSKYDVIVKKAIEFVENNYFKEIKIEHIVQEVFVTPNYFSQIFKVQTGVSFIDYLNNYRVEKAKTLLKEMDLKVYQVAEQVGYQSYKHFNFIFKKYTGYSPKEYREKHIDFL